MTSTLAKLQRRVGRFPIELPAAAALAAAIAFLVVALPDWRFERAVVASGLGNLVAAAQPPLGTTARIIAALGFGALSFLAAFFGLRALDHKPEVGDFPAFRAADLHPDAPRRRPILAGAEFGTPAEDPQAGAVPARKRALVLEPLPSFLAPQPPQIGDFVPAPDAGSDAATRAQPSGTSAGAAPAERSSATAPAPHPLLRTKPAAAARVPSFMQTPEPDAFFDTPSRPVPAARERTEQPVEDRADGETQEQDEQSVSDLMARLESGLSRHGGKPPADGAPGQEELRRALGDLNRLSNRRH